MTPIFVAMLYAKDICKTYGALEVLKGIDLEVAEKEVISIVGASGAGKSTLLHILASLDQPDQGSVSLKGQALFSLSSNKLAKFRNDHIGLIFQFHNLLPEFTALENVCIPGFIGNRNEAAVLKSGMALRSFGDHRKSLAQTFRIVWRGATPRSRGTCPDQSTGDHFCR